MIKLTLKRTHQNEYGTHGQLHVTDEVMCYTLEPPWEDNQKDVSCIPAGMYKMKRHHSPRFGNVFKIFDVPGRTDILIHIGNYLKNTLGCILVGTERRYADPEKMIPEWIAYSGKALIMLLKKFGDEDIELTIVEGERMEKKTSEEWFKELSAPDGIIILDFDGWDRENIDYSFRKEIITKDEYNRRLAFSTIYCVKY